MMAKGGYTDTDWFSDPDKYKYIHVNIFKIYAACVSYFECD